MPDLELKIEQLIVTARREALPSFDGKTATTVLVGRKLRLLLLFLTGYKAISVVEIRTKFLYSYTASILLIAM